MITGTHTTKIKRRRKERLFAEQNGLCYYCQNPMRLVHGANGEPDLATLDHVVPLSAGGPRGPTLNTVVACYQCNNERGNRSSRKFLREKQQVPA